jgi:hypothetical protein
MCVVWYPWYACDRYHRQLERVATAPPRPSRSLRQLSSAFSSAAATDSSGGGGGGDADGSGGGGEDTFAGGGEEPSAGANGDESWVAQSVTAFMAYVVRNFSTLREGRFLDVPSAFANNNGSSSNNNNNNHTHERAPGGDGNHSDNDGGEASVVGALATAAAALGIDDGAGGGAGGGDGGGGGGDGSGTTAVDNASTPALPAAAAEAAAAPVPVAPDTLGMVAGEDQQGLLRQQLSGFAQDACAAVLSGALSHDVLRSSSWDLLPSMLADAMRTAQFRPNQLKPFGVAMDSMAIGVRGIRAKMLASVSPSSGALAAPLPGSGGGGSAPNSYHHHPYHHHHHHHQYQQRGGGGGGGDASPSRSSSQARQSAIQQVFSGKALIFYPAIDAAFDYLSHALEYLPLNEINK